MVDNSSAELEQKLYDYAVILFKQGNSDTGVIKSLIEYGVSQQAALEIMARAKDRPADLTSKQKASRDTQKRERRKSARNFILASLGVGAANIPFTALLQTSRSSIGSIIVLILSSISALLFFVGAYRWINSIEINSIE